MNKTESTRLDRYKGAMIGVAVGDALGAPLEFMDAEQIKRKHGTVTEMIGGGWLSVEPGEVTDDTQMTLAVAEGLAASPSDEDIPELIGQNFLHWYAGNPKDVGNTCAAVLSRMSKTEWAGFEDWHRTAEEVTKSTNGGTAGNGALMRTVYPALFFQDEWEAQDAAVGISRMTHHHGTSDSTVRSYTEMVNSIANADITPEEAKKRVKSMSMTLWAFGETDGRFPPKPTGYSLDSYLCAVDAILNNDTFEDTLVDAVNRGGDADTIGAITGRLAGAIYGADAIPMRWIAALNNEPNHRTVRLFTDRDTDIITRLAWLATEAFEIGWEKEIFSKK